jgi:hypothetical protein
MVACPSPSLDPDFRDKAFRRIMALDDRTPGCVKVFGGRRFGESSQQPT